MGSPIDDARRAAAAADDRSSPEDRKGRRGRGPRVIGRAGTSLEGSPAWAANAAVARVGLAGERRTAEALGRGWRSRSGAGTPTVLHDLNMPLRHLGGNIDHVVVSGTRVTLIDSKAWASGFYWTVSGRTRRGMRAFAFADKTLMSSARTAVEKYLSTTARDVAGIEVVTPLIVVWAAGSGRLSLRLAATPGAELVTGPRFRRSVARRCGATAADPAIVEAMARLVVEGP